jgi:hypothetical protein
MTRIILTIVLSALLLLSTGKLGIVVEAVKAVRSLGMGEVAAKK